MPPTPSPAQILSPNTECTLRGGLKRRDANEKKVNRGQALFLRAQPPRWKACPATPTRKYNTIAGMNPLRLQETRNASERSNERLKKVEGEYAVLFIATDQDPGDSTPWDLLDPSSVELSDQTLTLKISLSFQDVTSV